MGADVGIRIDLSKLLWRKRADAAWSDQTATSIEKSPQVAAKFTFQAFRHQSKSLPVGGSAHFWHKSLTYPMLRGSGCCFGLWFHSTLHFLSFVFFCFVFFSVSKTDQLLPRYPERKLHFRKKKEKKKTNHFRLLIPLVSPPTVLLFSSQVSCTPASPSASLCPRVSTASDTADLPFPCVITRREPFGSAVRAGHTEECRWKSDSRVLLAQTSSRTCAVFPSRLCEPDHTGIPFNSLGGIVEPLERHLMATMQTTNPSHPPSFSSSSPFSSSSTFLCLFSLKCQNMKCNMEMAFGQS